MLQKHGHFNDISPKLWEEISNKVKALGKKVKFKFHISHENPDPEKYDGKIIYPNMYTLDPGVFRITDPYEERAGVSKSKEIGLINKVDREGIPESFHRVRVMFRELGIKEFKPEENADDFEYVMYLLMHPKLKNGQFQSADKTSVFELIDEQAEAKLRKDRRNAKVKALNVVRDMDEKKVIEFADAMLWDTTIEPDLLKDQVEELAETNPDLFNDLISGKSLEYQATIKRALDKQIWAFDPAEYKIIWTSNQQTVTVLQPTGEKNHVEKAAEWLMTGGQKCDEIYKRLKGLVTK